MIQTKQTYEAPEAVTLVVQVEGVICESTTKSFTEEPEDDIFS